VKNDETATAKSKTLRPTKDGAELHLEPRELEALYRYLDKDLWSQLASNFLDGCYDPKWFHHTKWRRNFIGDIIGQGAADEIRHESDDEFRDYMGEGGFRIITQGSDESQATELRGSKADDSELDNVPTLDRPCHCKKDIAYRHGKMTNAALRTQAVAYLQANPEGVFVDPDGDRWHWDDCRAREGYCSGSDGHLEFPVFVLVLTLSTASHGVSSTRRVQMPRPDGWRRPNVSLDETWGDF
jgi:hypothetical protein